jgi:hypothetical protein
MGILKPRYGGTGLGGGFSSGNIIWAVDEQTLTTGAVSSLPGLAEAIQDVVGAMAVAGTGISIVYDDGLGTLTVSNTGVTSVGLSAPSQFSVSGSPVTTTGTLALAWVSQTANTVLSGPTTGAAAAPTFRSLVAADIPSLTASKISDFGESVDDRVNSLLVAGTGIDKSYNDAGDALTLSVKRSFYAQLVESDPTSTGAHTFEFVVPYSPADGTTSITWNFRRVEVRVRTAGTGTMTFQLEKSTASGAFSATNVLTSALSLTSGNYEANTTSFSVATVASGNKLRVNFSAVSDQVTVEVFVLAEASV